MGGFPLVWGGEWDSEEKLFGEAQKENMTLMHAFGNFWWDLG